jgi:hypothetical protein
MARCRTLETINRPDASRKTPYVMIPQAKATNPISTTSKAYKRPYRTDITGGSPAGGGVSADCGG